MSPEGKRLGECCAASCEGSTYLVMHWYVLVPTQRFFDEMRAHTSNVCRCRVLHASDLRLTVCHKVLPMPQENSTRVSDNGHDFEIFEGPTVRWERPVSETGMEFMSGVCRVYSLVQHIRRKIRTYLRIRSQPTTPRCATTPRREH